YPSQHP
ncbi:autotransporter beta-domain protein, partial [Chlamydia psittaci 02DC14]